MFKQPHTLVLLLLALALLAGCGGAPSTPTPEPPTPTPTSPPTATPTPRPTATPTPEPTATPTPEPTPTPTPEPTATPTPTPLPPISLTEAEYRNDTLELLWQRPDDQWDMLDASDLEGMFGQLIPLVTLAHKTEELYITLLTIDLPAVQVRALANLMVTNPEQALAAMAGGMGELGQNAILSEVGGARAVLVPVPVESGGTNFMWIVPRSPGVIYLLAEGFADAEAAAAPFAKLTFRKAAAAADLTPEEQRSRLMAQVEELRGLEAKEPVNFAFLTREELRQRLEERMEKELVRPRMAASEQMLKLLGLIPADLDLAQTVLEVQAADVLGFYNPDDRTFYLVDDTQAEPMTAVEQATFVHEYVHALQDQHFGLGRLTAEDTQLNEDQKGALRALAEGDATLLMGFWAATTLSPDQLQEIADQGAELNATALDAAPPYLRAGFMFPYQHGSQFARAVVSADGWQALDELWGGALTSTEQILHPEKVGEDEPTAVTLPADLAQALGTGWQEAWRDVWGEIDLVLWTQEALGDDAFDVAAGWDGSQYVFLSNAAGRGLFAIEIAWDGAADAKEGSDGLARWLKANGFTGTGANWTAADGRAAFLRASGDRVYFALGNAAGDLKALVTALRW
ncbi:MAG: hypothetical protein NZ528_08790 [Caldilineales bacterium]|nr:hypothetical protein [Caldilineales bacterium]